MTVDIIFGGNAGSEGKGKFAGFLAKKYGYKHVISNFFPNAGHTWVSDTGTKIITRLLPSSLVNESTQLYIGPGACLNIEVLFNEIKEVEEAGFNVKKRLHIHPRASIIEDSHIEMEKNERLGRIGSTLKGGSAGIALKAMRSERQKLARDEGTLSGYICNTEQLLQEVRNKGESILIEGAQGFELDINYGYEYPYTTSRQTTPSQLLADCGIPVKAVRDIYCVLRPFPIRVANPEEEGETSGALAGEEIEWSKVEEDAGAPQGTFSEKENTTVTNRRRRVFKLDDERLIYMTGITKPSFLCLNFIQYINFEDHCKTKYENLSDKSRSFIEHIERITKTPVKFIGTGERDCDVIER